MINIKNKKNCCGCSACIQRCPKQCIVLTEDEEGFLYPKVNLQLCIDCNLCEKVCPVINPQPAQTTHTCYAGMNQNKTIRLQSSSGGLFTPLAETIIKENGIVFGACFDENWEVKHDYTETIEGIANFRGSKYVQSRIEDNYKKAEIYLKEGRTVLFSGTPCQIAGLKKYLRKEYENLLTVDFICHGVPSPKIWRAYLDTICRSFIEKSEKNAISSILTDRGGKFYIEAINFRNKILGWKKYSFFIKFNSTFIQGGKNTEEFFEPFSENPFMKGFLKNIYLRPSCYNCPSKNGKSRSDITLADFWGIQDQYPDWDDDKGTSAIFVNTNKGAIYFDKIQNDNIHYKKVTYNDIVNSNKSYELSCNEPPYRNLFWKKYIKREELDDSLFQPTVKDKIILKLKRHFKL